MVGEKVKIDTSIEGGELCLKSASGKYTYQIDACGEDLRLVVSDNGYFGSGNYSSFVLYSRKYKSMYFAVDHCTVGGKELCELLKTNS